MVNFKNLRERYEKSNKICETGKAIKKGENKMKDYYLIVTEKDNFMTLCDDLKIALKELVKIAESIDSGDVVKVFNFDMVEHKAVKDKLRYSAINEGRVLIHDWNRMDKNPEWFETVAGFMNRLGIEA